MKKGVQIKLAFSVLNTMRNVIKHISGMSIFESIRFNDCTNDEWEIIDDEICFREDGSVVGLNDELVIIDNIVLIAGSYYDPNKFGDTATTFLLLDMNKMTSEKELFDEHLENMWGIKPK